MCDLQFKDFLKSTFDILHYEDMPNTKKLMTFWWISVQLLSLIVMLINMNFKWQNKKKFD